MKFDIVFEGGGAKGMAFTAAIEEFDARGHTYGRLLGTSSGAIAATLLASGYRGADAGVVFGNDAEESPLAGFMAQPEEFSREQLDRSVLRDVLKRFDIPLLPDGLEARLDAAVFDVLTGSPIFRNVFSLVEFGGWYAADRFMSWLTSTLDSGTFRGGQRRFSGLTLDQHFAITGTELTLVAADVSHSSQLILNHRTAPDCPLIWAVRMSMSVPMLWPEVVWRPEWGSYRGRPLAGASVVDGGVLSNFPIELFVSGEPHVVELVGPGDGSEVIGLLLDEAIRVPALPLVPEQPSTDYGQRRTVERLERLIQTAIHGRDKLVMDAFEDIVVRIPAGGVGSTDFEMSLAVRAALCEGGRVAMRAHLDRGRSASSEARGAAAARMTARLRPVEHTAGPT